MLRKYPALSIVFPLFLACANEFADAQSPTGSHPNVGILITGDTGYGPEYPEDTDFEDRFSEEQYLVSVPNDGHSPFVPLIEYSFDRRSHRYDQSD